MLVTPLFLRCRNDQCFHINLHSLFVQKSAVFHGTDNQWSPTLTMVYCIGICCTYSLCCAAPMVWEFFKIMRLVHWPSLLLCYIYPSVFPFVTILYKEVPFRRNGYHTIALKIPSIGVSIDADHCRPSWCQVVPVRFVHGTSGWTPPSCFIRRYFCHHDRVIFLTWSTMMVI